MDRDLLFTAGEIKDILKEYSNEKDVEMRSTASMAYHQDEILIGHLKWSTMNKVIQDLTWKLDTMENQSGGNN